MMKWAQVERIARRNSADYVKWAREIPGDTKQAIEAAFRSGWNYGREYQRRADRKKRITKDSV